MGQSEQDNWSIYYDEQLGFQIFWNLFSMHLSGYDVWINYSKKIWLRNYLLFNFLYFVDYFKLLEFPF